MMLHFGTCISHFGADTPCFWSAYSPHWCEAASGLAIALLPWIPFQFVGLLGQVYVFSPMRKDSSFCRTPLSTSSKTTRTNMSFNLSVEFWLMFMGYQPARDLPFLLTCLWTSKVWLGSDAPPSSYSCWSIQFLAGCRLRTLFSCWHQLEAAFSSLLIW